MTANAAGFNEYANPESNPTLIRHDCFAFTQNGIVVAPDGIAFVSVDGRHHLPISSYITRIEPHESGCSTKRHRLYAVPTFIDPIDITVHDNHLFVADAQYGSGGPAVVVMKEHSTGYQAPLFVLRYPAFRRPRGLGVGP